MSLPEPTPVGPAAANVRTQEHARREQFRRNRERQEYYHRLFEQALEQHEALRARLGK